MEMRKYTGEGSTLLVKVHRYDGKNIQGTLCDVSSNVRYVFTNMTQLIMKIEEILDTKDREPASKAEIFGLAKKEGKYEMVQGSKPWIYDKLRVFLTFKLSIRFRRFGTWQGLISCVDTGKTCAFRNVLEMTLMMDSEMEAAGTAVEATDVAE
ncbi:MAG: hypothetical protein ACI4VM_01870 [Anaerovoracaceae bacterium]